MSKLQTYLLSFQWNFKGFFTKLTENFTITVRLLITSSRDSSQVRISTPSFQRPKTLPPSSGNVEELSFSLANSRLRPRSSKFLVFESGKVPFLSPTTLGCCRDFKYPLQPILLSRFTFKWVFERLHDSKKPGRGCGFPTSERMWGLKRCGTV